MIHLPDDATWFEGESPLRFDDITQDGRIVPGALMPGLGATTWPALIGDPSTRALLSNGIIPILSRLEIEAADGPFGVATPLRSRGGFRLGHVPADPAKGAAPDGKPRAERLLLGMWLVSTLPIGSVYGGSPSTDERVEAGRVYAEHTLTRPFAGPGERRVTRLEVPGFDAIPGPATSLVPPDAVALPPAGARLLDDAATPHGAPTVFGYSHTDPNQHVNSLVYVRLFEEAALVRLAALGRDTRVSARRVHIAYRKPSFAGDAMLALVQLYEHDGAVGAVGGFVEAVDAVRGGAQPPLSSARVFVHLVMR